MKPVEETLSFYTVKSEGCWTWVGARRRDGYGILCRAQTTFQAHRVMYEMLVGPIPEGLQLDHLCRNRSCVNPAHLEPVIAKENVLRGEGLCAINARKTHCKRGHPFSPTNTRLDKLGRACRTCDRIRLARYRSRLKDGRNENPS